MSPLPLLAALFLALAGAADAAATPPDLTGVWVLTTGETPLLHDKDVSLTPYGRARMEARRKEIAAGFVRSEGHVKCAPAGMPQMMSAPFAIQIMQNADRLLIAPEISTLPRTVYLKAQHPRAEDLDPSWNGHSIAHWEGQTLVVDTVGFNDEDAFDFNFDPPVKRTPALHVVERMRLQKGGQELVDEMTLIDPTTFVTPAKITYVYRKLPPTAGLMEYVCEVDVPALQAFEAQKTDKTPRYKHPF